MPSLAQVKADLAGGGKSRGLVEQCLARIADQSGEGGRVFLKVHAADALAVAICHALAPPLLRVVAG